MPHNPDEFGAGIIYLPVDVSTSEKRNGNMDKVVDLPVNVAAALLKEGSESHQQLMQDIRINSATAHNLARLGAIRQFSELDTIESRAHSGVIATPVASPATQQG